MAEATKRGRPSAGPRVEITTRVRPEIHDALKALAKARGTTLTDVLLAAIEKELGVEAGNQQTRNRVSQVA